LLAPTVADAAQQTRTKAKPKPKPRRTVSKKTSRNTYKQYRQAYASALVIEAETGQVLFQKSPDELRAPASLTKMMTELLALEALERNLVSLGDTVTVPSAVRAVGGSRVRLRPDEQLPFDELLHAMAISSANDAALVVAHHVAGSEAQFVELMNQRARELGMRNTHYVNPHGLDRNDQPGSLTTACDLSILARELLKHPMALEVASTVTDTIRGCQVIHTTNRLLGTCHGVDGLKTGYTGKAGFCLVSTAEREGMRIVSVLLGATSNRRRFSESAGLIASAYERFKKIPIIRKGQDLGKSCTISDGSTPQVRLVAREDVAVLLRSGNQREITMQVEAPPVVIPPIEAGAPLGLLRVLVGDSLAVQVPAVAARAVRKANLFDRLGVKLGWID
jgi:D-alanyl-D-alanine carboxypeptidase (penicillin-binding protein 5/6)